MNIEVGQKILVYGTLRPGERAGHYLSFGACHLGEDSINGLMYDLGSFPGVKAQAQDYDPTQASITGDVYEILDGRLPVMLDQYEGFPHLYTRVVTKTARGIPVWVYIYNGSVSDSQLIQSGDWKQRAKSFAFNPVAA